MTAAAARKLQKEIEVTLKKVDEGIDEFAEQWDQATTASSNAQRDKLGEELKKSINKLQRLRVQIREWIGQSDIKGNSKEKLEDARKRIEADMQRFKEFERDLKTKAFSSTALSKEDDIDIEELEKMKNQEWLSTIIQSLNDQKDQFEADLELLGNKKSLSNSEKEEVVQNKAFQERHAWHIKKLELLLRALDNDAIDMSDLAVLRDSVDYYLESHAEPDFVYDEGMYDGFNLHEIEAMEAKPMTPTASDAAKAQDLASTETPKRKDREREKRKKDEKKEKKKQDADAKKPGTPGSVSAKATLEGSAKGPAAKSGGGSTPGGSTTPGAGGGLDDLATDEFKVQADQLMSEAEEFICKICQVHVVGCSPKLTNCSHLFCGDCLAQWFAQHPESQSWAQRARSAGPERTVPCPVCKQPLNEKRDLYPVCGATSRSENLLLWRMLSSLKIMCENHCRIRVADGRCDWVGEYGQYQKHIASCRNVPLGGVAALTDAEPAPTVERSVPEFSTPERGALATAGPARTAQEPTSNVPVPPPAATHAAEKRVVQAPRTPPTDPPRGTPQEYRKNSDTLAPLPNDERGSAAAAPHQAGKVITPAVAAPAAAAVAPTHGVATPPTAQTSYSQSDEALKQQAAQQARLQAAEAEKARAQREAAAASARAEEARAQRERDAARESQAAAAKPDNSWVTRAISAFEATGPTMVHVRPGDMIQVLEQHTSGWTYCRNVNAAAGATATGWAPSWIVGSPESSAAAAAAAAPKAAAGTNKAQEVQQQKDSAPKLSGQPLSITSAPTPQHGTAVTHSTPPTQHIALSSLQGRSDSASEAAKPEAAAAAATESAQAGSAAPLPAATPKAPQTMVRAATAPFAATSASQLGLALGDLVEIVERDTSGWTYGRKVLRAQQPNSADSAATLEGWFPDWCCAQK